MTGLKFFRLAVISKAGTIKGKLAWNCVCECGTNLVVLGESLRSGNSKSCGCLQKEAIRKTAKTHGLSRTLTHRIWCGVLTRCTNSNHHSYANYGARGINVCERWLKFENFLSDMGECPQGMSLDRINNNGNYEPSNCRWADSITQTRNQRDNKLITAFGKTLCLSAWSEQSGIKRETISRRLELGWDTEKAVSQQPR